MIKAFKLLAILIAGQAMVQSVQAEEPPYPVELIYSKVDSDSVTHDSFREYLRHEADALDMPTTITYRIDCYSDGSGQVFPDKNYEKLFDILNSDGQHILRGIMVEWGGYICKSEWSEKYGDSAARESKPTWHL